MTNIKIKLAMLPVLLLCSTLTILAQNKLEHKVRRYISPEGRVYVNKTQPIYLFMGHSPEDKSDLHRLKSESSPEFTNPLYLDTEGYNTIRTSWKYDTVTHEPLPGHQDIIFEVYADGLSPLTRIKFTGAPKYTNASGTVYYGKGLKVGLSATDQTSGVEQILYSINGETFKKYASEVIINDEKSISFKYYSADNVGNSEDIKAKDFVMDLTAPVVTHSIDGNASGNIISPYAKLVLNAEDALSGVKQIKYEIVDGAEKTYYGPIKLSSLADGNHKLIYYGIDKVLNSGKEDAKNKPVIFDFYLDKTAPEVSASIEGDQHKSKYLYISERSKCKLTATDNKSGVLNIVYSIDVSSLGDSYNSPFTLPSKKGLHNVFYRSTDKVQNKSSLKKYTLYMDNKLPKTNIIYGYPKFYNRDTLFISRKTKISLSSNDYESGIQKTEYKIDDKSFVEYEKFSINEEGIHKISFRSTDNVNNIEADNTSEVFVDNKAPEIFIKYNIEPIRQVKNKGQLIDVFPMYIKVYLAATDEDSGTNTIFYSINGGFLKDYSTGRNTTASNFFSKPGIYDLRVVAKDMLGNESEKTVSFKVTKK